MTTTLLTAVGYGCRVGLLVPTIEADAARDWLPFWWRDQPLEPQRVWAADSAAACEWVIRELELWVAEHATDFVFIHAGVVAVDGRALLLPGRSFVGKSTLVAALLRAGADYLSDEYAVLDDDGSVNPYPRPIALRNDDGTRSRVLASSLGAHTILAPTPVRFVMTVGHRPGAALELRQVRAADAVLSLIDNAVAARSEAERVLSAAVAAVGGSITMTGTRGESDAAARELVEFVRSR